MKELIKSRLFRRLFFTYILVIFTCLVVYMAVIIYENHKIQKLQTDRICELQLLEVRDILDQRVMNARNIVRNLSSSNSMKKLYLDTKLGNTVDSYTSSEIMTELRTIPSSGDPSVYMVIIFVEGGGKAYSSGDIINLTEPYQTDDTQAPGLVTGNMNAYFGMKNEKYLFQQEYLIYTDSFTYRNGGSMGTICILFNMDNFQDELKKTVNDGYGAVILSDGVEVARVGNTDGKSYSTNSVYDSGITCQVFAPAKPVAGENTFYYVILCVMILITIGFVLFAYLESCRYYKPIDHIGQMVREKGMEGAGETSLDEVNSEKSSGKDEMETIINDISSLIGEKNVYRERMMVISPYASTGALHTMLTGNMEKENIRILSENNYLDLIKPYFIVGAVNLAYSAVEGKEQEKHNLELFKLMTETLSTDETHLVYYFRDKNNVFLIVNSELEGSLDELFFQIHRYLCTALEKDGCIVTMGVEVPRNDISELKEACEGATRALDGILTNGRGEVYFLEEDNRHVEHYFPDNIQGKLRKYLEKNQKEEIRLLLKDIYQKNWELAGSPEMYRVLVDELHLAVIKALREITELKMTHINVEKYTGLATLEEIFDYYEAALCSIADTLDSRRQQVEEETHLEDEIITYIDEHSFDPELSQQAISDKYKVSGKYLSLLCKKRFGVTYLQYIQTKRIRRAEELLKERKHSLAEIALVCGYTSQLTFRRNFKNITGMNPSDYENGGK